ncbi:uncharacterized protein LOC126992394 isoform X1 [Eriocheir sinensis]|uniref:uncharacterized protein LOC126992394 isoform X1 n=1 Tax=Eriocheir sinensis TaxID=95602 RepID=UPI0021C860D6|nr:uncharacterized protein LOC126992394 isoform X1 [Eriocheir sinensis]
MPRQTSPVALALATAVAVALSMPLLATGAPAAAAPQPVIANGSSVAVAPLAEAFLFCWVDAAAAVQEVEWRDAADKPLPSWTPGADAFQLGRGRHLPHAYLVLADFRQDLAGVYTCVARGEAGVEGRASVAVSLDDAAPWARR